MSFFSVRMCYCRGPLFMKRGFKLVTEPDPRLSECVLIITEAHEIFRYGTYYRVGVRTLAELLKHREHFKFLYTVAYEFKPERSARAVDAYLRAGIKERTVAEHGIGQPRFAGAVIRADRSHIRPRILNSFPAVA